MSVLHQMGHDSENLLLADGLERYSGAILSPVNYDEQETRQQLAMVRRSGREFEFVFDPQLYVPTSDRGCLRDWDYFPADVDTADLSSHSWWEGLCGRIAQTVTRVQPDAACSPAALPRTFSNEYFGSLVEVGECFAAALRGSGIAPIQSAVVGLADLATPSRAFAVASILTTASTRSIYLVFVGSTDPRRELSDVEEVKGAMKLISLLREAGYRVIVGFCSSDMLLWKVAGANDCATGKFFNLRRFTRGRFEEPGGGGGQLPYWMEESLVAFLREADLLRVDGRGLLSDSSQRNPFAPEIRQRIAEGRAWVALSWRQYLFWFADAEARIGSGALNVPNLLREAEQHWQELEDHGVLMDEPRNNGSWLRPWRRAINEFRQP